MSRHGRAPSPPACGPFLSGLRSHRLWLLGLLLLASSVLVGCGNDGSPPVRYADYAAIVFRRGRPMARRSPLTRPGRQRRDLRDERRRHEPHATPLTTRHTTNCPRGGEGHSTATRETRRIGGPSSASCSTSVCDSTTTTPGFPRNTCPPFRSWARETLPPSPTCRTGQILSPRLGAAYDLFANGGIFTGLISDPRPPSLSSTAARRRCG